MLNKFNDYKKNLLGEGHDYNTPEKKKKYAEISEIINDEIYDKVKETAKDIEALIDNIKNEFDLEENEYINFKCNNGDMKGMWPLREIVFRLFKDQISPKDNYGNDPVRSY